LAGLQLDLALAGRDGRAYRSFAARHCRDALYLDGSVSSLWDPANGRMDRFSGLGSMIVAVRDL